MWPFDSLVQVVWVNANSEAFVRLFNYNHGVYPTTVSISLMSLSLRLDSKPRIGMGASPTMKKGCISLHPLVNAHLRLHKPSVGIFWPPKLVSTCRVLLILGRGLKVLKSLSGMILAWAPVSILKMILICLLIKSFTCGWSSPLSMFIISINSSSLLSFLWLWFCCCWL